MKYLALPLFLFIFALTCIAQDPAPPVSTSGTTPAASPDPVAESGIKEVKLTTGDDVPPPTRSSGRYVPKNAPARIARLASAITIDGVLNDEAWKSATAFGDFIQTNPGDNIAPKYQT